MIVKTVEYTDYNGVNRKEDHHFNLTEAEMVEMEGSVNGGFTGYIQRIIDTQDQTKMLEIFKDLLLKSYGQKSLDGRRFIKNDQLREEFSQTEAFSILYMELAFDDKKASEFINGLLPAKVREAIKKNGTAMPVLEASKENPNEIIGSSINATSDSGLNVVESTTTLEASQTVNNTNA